MAEIREVLVEIATRLREADDRRLANVAASGMVAALVNADALEEAQAVLNAYAGPGTVKPGAEPLPEPPAELAGDGGRAKNGGMHENDGLLDAEVVVLEVRVNEKGVTRAWCQDAETGDKVAVYAKNGAGQTLASAVRRKVAVRYRVVDKGWFVAEVRAVS